MFYDLNLPRPLSATPNESFLELIQSIRKHGYRGLAINTEYDESLLEKPKKVKEKHKQDEKKDLVPPPFDLKELKLKYPELQIHNRITITITEVGSIQKIFQSRNLKKYDIIGFRPENQNCLKALAGNPDVDIISYNPESRCNLKYSRKLYNQFVVQNAYFELVYSKAIMDSTCRKNLISLAHLYHAVGKSKNIIVSSEAATKSYIRGPYDIVNLCLLFGLSEEGAKNSVSRNCERLVLKAKKQRRGKSVVELCSRTTVENNQSESMEIQATE